MEFSPFMDHIQNSLRNISGHLSSLNLDNDFLIQNMNTIIPKNLLIMGIPYLLFYCVTHPLSCGPKARQFERICSRARISARGNVLNPLQLGGCVPEARSASGTLRISGTAQALCPLQPLVSAR